VSVFKFSRFVDSGSPSRCWGRVLLEVEDMILGWFSSSRGRHLVARLNKPEKRGESRRDGFSIEVGFDALRQHLLRASLRKTKCCSNLLQVWSSWSIL
jgi:hypothetical protein